MTVLGLDIGTSSVKGVLLDAGARVTGTARRSYPLDTPGPGHVELPTDRVARAIDAVVGQLSAKARAAGRPVRAIAASGSGDEVVMVDAAGRPIGPVVVALDTRASACGQAFQARIGEETLYQRTGLPDCRWAPLIRFAWLRARDPAAAARVRSLLAWPEWLALRLGVEPRSEPSLAGRTLAFELGTQTYARDLLSALGVESSLLPPVVPTGSTLGTIEPVTAERLGLAQGAVFVAGGFDQAMATLGAGVTRPGRGHLGLGSYAAVSVLLDQPFTAPAIRDAGWATGRAIDGSTRWSAMASWVGAAALGWLARVAMGGASGRGASAVERLDRDLPDRPSVPLAVTGLDGGRAAFVGLDLATGIQDLAAAVMESVALDLRRVLSVLDTAGVPVAIVRASGGGARSRRWLQVVADVTSCVVERPDVPETGAFAAAILAGSAIGAWSAPASVIDDLVGISARFEPRPALADHYATRAVLHDRLRQALAERQTPGAPQAGSG